jgi:hypothetical protein
MPAIALVVGGGISAIGSVASGALQANAAQTASQEQVTEQQAALAQQQALFNQGLAVQQGDVAAAQKVANPLISSATTGGQGLIGQGTSDIQNALTGPSSIGTALTSFLMNPTSANAISNLPGVQTLENFGLQNVQNQATANGLSGNVLTAGSQFSNALAQQNFGTVTNAMISGLLAQIQGGSSIAGTGSSEFGAGTGLAGSLVGGLTGAGNATLNAAANTGSAEASTISGIGQAQAAGTTGSANAISTGITGATSGISSALLLNSLLGKGSSANPASTNGVFSGTTPAAPVPFTNAPFSAGS